MRWIRFEDYNMPDPTSEDIEDIFWRLRNKSATEKDVAAALSMANAYTL